MKFPTSGEFAVVYADPPWAFKTRDKGSKNAVPTLGEQPYETMTLDDLKALGPKIEKVTAADCALFMWAIDSHLEQALELGRAWGFTFKTRAFTWRKLTKDGQSAAIGMGFWTRKQTEFCLLFTKGSPKRQSGAVREIIDAPRREHSRKPDEAYERIEALVNGPYLELFARRHREGWSGWGDQLSRRRSKKDLLG